VPSTFDICYFDGFQNNKLYELIYPAKNPIVMAPIPESGIKASGGRRARGI
jgi:hypothetical protein